MARFRNVIALFAVVLCCAGVAAGQVRSSSITGTIADVSGAVIPNTKVIVTNQDTRVSQETQSNQSGEYTVPYLQAGRYTIEAQFDGFQTQRVTDLVLGTSTTVRANLTLTPGPVTTSVEVEASAATLQTESSVVQGSVNETIITAVPNLNNNPLYYATLQAGVVGAPQVQQSTRLGVGFQDRQFMSAIRINGGQMGSNDVQLDGLSVQGAAWHETTVVPNRDALQEVRVVTNSFAADLGNGQGLISMTTKSGSNEIHGGLNYRMRNEALNANGLRNNMLKIDRSKYRVHDGGGSLGGPVVIPKMIDGRNKLFFFGSFWRLTYSEPLQSLSTVPTERERSGDFSQTLVADNQGNPVPVQIFNPYSATAYQGSRDVFIRSPFPGATIPNPNPIAMKYLNAYPLPNRAPSNPYGADNYFFDGPRKTVRNNMAGRLDYKLGTTHSFYGTGGFQNGSIDQPNRWGEGNPFVNMGWPGLVSDNNWYSAIGDTVVLSPTLVMDVRYGVTRINTAASYPAGAGFNYDEYGMPKEVQSLIAVWGSAPSTRNFGNAPNRNITNLNRDGWARKNEHQTNHTITGSLTKMSGRWTLKSGAEYRNRLGNWADLLNGTPELMASNHSGQLGGLSGDVSGLVTDPALRGVGLASALTGAMAWSLQSGTTTAPALSAKYFALYTQNDWRATDRLTLNLGLRWEVQPGPTDRYNHGSSLDLTAPNPFASGKQLSHPQAALGLIAFPGTAGYSRNLWDTRWTDFGPRFGAAYRLLDRTVLRGGYGLMYTPSNTGFNANGLVYGTGPFSGGALRNEYGLAPNGVPVGTFADPQNTILVQPPGAVQAPQIYGNAPAALSVDYFPRDRKNGRTHQWNFFVEQRFGASWLASAGYVGSHGTDLSWRGFPLTGTWRLPDTTLRQWRDIWYNSSGLTNPANVQVDNPIPELAGKAAGPIGGAKMSTLNSLQPYLPLLGQTYLGNQGDSNYHALQLRLTRAYAFGLQGQFNYTWSKATGLIGGPGSASYAESQVAGGGASAAGGVDYRNLENNRGYLNYDVTHRFVSAVVYDLPFGRGRMFDFGSGALNTVAGGWQLGTVVTLKSGQPWGPSCGTMNGRCIPTGEPLELPGSLHGWYDGKTPVTLPNGRTITPPANRYLRWNPDAFTAPVVQFPNGNYQIDQYVWGATSQYITGLRTPNFYNINLTVNKKFEFTERVRLEFVAESSNLFNQTMFNPVGVNGGVNPALQANTATNTKVGQNSNLNFGTLDVNQLFEPRQVTLSLRLVF